MVEKLWQYLGHSLWNGVLSGLETEINCHGTSRADHTIPLPVKVTTNFAGRSDRSVNLFRLRTKDHRVFFWGGGWFLFPDCFAVLFKRRPKSRS
jgi:hypothetical protein